MKTVLLMILCPWTLIACNAIIALEPSKIKNEPFVLDNTYKYARAASDKHVGTIWKGEQVSNTFFVDQRAKAIGDIITINIVEVSQASEAATTDLTRKGTVDAGIPHFFGLEGKIPLRNP